MTVEISPSIVRLSVEEKARLMGGREGRYTWDCPSIGLASMRWFNGPSGVNARLNDHDFPTLTPCPTALAATWDADLVRQVGRIIGDEARARDVHVIHAPNLNLPRSPLGGRDFEQFSEDPWLTGTLGAAWLQGVQSRHVAAVAKHLVCNDSETERQTMNAVVNERVLREVYLLPFEMAISAGVWGIMAAYNRVNGSYCAEHTFLIRKIVKGEWRFDGFVMSDFHGTHSAASSALAGLDLEMPGPPVYYGEKLAAAVREGTVPESNLDESVGRLLRAAARTGRLEGASVEAPPTVENPREILLRATAAGFVLLKNDGRLLPLATGSRLALIGPLAATPTLQGAGFSQLATRDNFVTPLAALQARFSEVVHEPGVPSPHKVPLLREIDITTSDGPGLLVEYFREGDSDPQLKEVRTSGSMVWNLRIPGLGPIDRPGRIHVSGVLKPSVGGVHRFFIGCSAAYRLEVDGRTVLEQGPQPPVQDTGTALRPTVRSIECELLENVNVRIDIDMPFGPSRAHSLHFGCRPPEPVTIACQDTDYGVFDLTPVKGDLVYEAAPTIGYRHFEARGIQPRFAFGQGLGYADFSYADLHVEPLASGEVHVSVCVTNIAQCGGKEVVQVYTRRPGEWPELKGCAVLQLEAGQTVTALIDLPERAFARWSTERRAWEVPAGTHDILVGRSVSDIRLHTEVTPRR